jgi:hypothetical protein
MVKGIGFALAIAVAGCAGMQAKHDALESAKVQSQIVVDVDEPPDRVTPRVMQAFMSNQLTVSSSQNSLIEAKLAREQGLLGQYEIAARALVLPNGTGSQVTLYAEELRMDGETKVAATERVSGYSRGRAGQAWSKLQSVAQAVQPDPAKRHATGQP